MKRILAFVLTLCLLATSACAGGTILQSGMDDSWYISSMAPVGDTLYLMTVNYPCAQLLRWQKGMAEAEVVADQLLWGDAYSTIEEMSMVEPTLCDRDMAHALSVIFTDGEGLYGFNGMNKLVFRIEPAADGLRCTDVATLPGVPVMNQTTPIAVQKAGNRLLWLAYDRNSCSSYPGLLVFNLDNGTVKAAVLPRLHDIVAYRDGRVIAVCEKEYGGLEAYVYDPVTDACIPLGTLPDGAQFTQAAYSRELDMLVYQQFTRVMGWHPDTGVEQLGFLPADWSSSVAVLQDQFLMLQEAGVKACDITRGYAPEHSVTVIFSNVDAAGQRFNGKYPDVPYYYGSWQGGSNEELLRQADAPDLVYLTSACEYDELVELGLLADLSVYPDIRAYTEALYPAYQTLVKSGDAIYGVPVWADAYNGWFINKEVMNALGLTPEDIPTSLTGLCAFATRWNDEFAEKYPQYTLLNNTSTYRERLLEAMLMFWEAYCEATGRALTYDDPILREALTALDAAHLDKLDKALRQTNPEVSEYKQALIWTGCKTVGNWRTYMEPFSDRIFLPMTLTSETPYTCAVQNIGLWCLNAASADADYAVAMLSEIIAEMEDVVAYVLRSDKTEPLLDEFAEDTLACYMEELTALEAKLDESVSREAIVQRIAEQRTFIEDQLMPQLYTVVPSALENYVKVIAPASFVSHSLPGSGMECCDDERVISYIDGKCTLEELITALNELTEP